MAVVAASDQKVVKADMPEEEPGGLRDWSGVVTQSCCILVLAVLLYMSVFTKVFHGHRLADPYRVTALLFIVAAWRDRCRKLYLICGTLREEHGRMLRQIVLCIDYYTPLYVCLSCILYGNLYMIYLYEYKGANMLSAESIEGHAKRAATIGNGTDAVVNQTIYDKILDEVSLSTNEYDTILLRWLPLLSPVAVCVVFLICTHAVVSHVRAIWAQTSYDNTHKMHDYVIQINTLPLVYAIMSLMSVMRTWEIVTLSTSAEFTKHISAWDEQKEFLLAMSDANFCCADVLEAWCIRVFGFVTLFVMKTQVKEKVLSNVVQKEATEDEQQLASSTTERLLTMIDGLADLGISSFFWSCLLSSLWALAQMWITFYKLFDLSDSIKTKIHALCLGIGSLASSIAIMNIIAVETKFHKELEAFKPFLKFWSAKILVSIAFLQSILLIPLQNVWSSTQANLFYSAMLCYECLIVALMHQCAWPVDEDWYRAEEDNNNNDNDKTRPLLQNAA
jgi:hypothetical protein